jgi:hypothetical protein
MMLASSVLRSSWVELETIFPLQHKHQALNHFGILAPQYMDFKCGHMGA